MASIVETSIKRPLLILVVFTILALGGILTYSMLNLKLLPSFEVQTLTVQIIYPGASASEVETSVTKKVEDALSTLENLTSIRSTSMEGLSVITLSMDDKANTDQSVQDAQRKINIIKSQLPSEIYEPSIDKFSMDEQAIMEFAASSSMPSTEFFQLVKDRIQPRLAKLTGVGSVQISGGNEREIKVNIDAEKLRSYNLSVLQVVQAVQTSNMEIPTGNVENTGTIYSVRLAAKYSNLDELRNTVISTMADGGNIKVADVAEVEDGVAEQNLITRINSNEAIGFSVKKQNDANAVLVADLIKAELANIETEYADEDIHFEMVADESVFTKASANSVVFDLFLAILIVAFICFIFLHNYRSALIIMIAIPLSIIPTFIVMYALGYSLNMLSLVALSLVVGILVDDSIVVVENMFHYLEQGKSKVEAAILGCKQIMLTCMAITVVIVVVFFPMVISGGMIGNMLKEFAVPIIVSVLCSLLVSFTVTPLLMSRFGSLSDTTGTTLGARFSRIVEKAFASVKNWYAKVLAISLNHKAIVLIVAFVLFISSFTLLTNGFIGFAFIPEIDKGEFTVALTMNPQTTVYQNNQITMQAEQIIADKAEVQHIYTNVGKALNGMSKNNESTILVKMTDKEQRDISVETFAEQVKNELTETIAGVQVKTMVSSISGNTTEPLQYIVQGADFEKVREAADIVMEAVRNTPGAVDAKFSIDDPSQEVQVKLDREKMSRLGLSAADVGSTMRMALNGNDDSKFSENDYEYKIRIGLDKFDRTRPEDVSKLTFMNKSGKIIELNQIADINYGLGASVLERSDRVPSITVKSNVSGRATGTVGAEIREKFEDKIPSGVSIKEGGMLEVQSDAFGSLAFAFIAALVLIYLIMVVLYNSLLDPVIILFSIPLSMIGAFLALALTMNDLTLFSIIGLIVLIGLVAKNAILLVDFANRLHREEGMDTFGALIEAGRERLRPILMTTFAMIFGMLPIALATGHGAELKTGMAWVIIGGLTSSMILTLVVVPVVYLMFDKTAEKINRRKQARLVLG